MATRHFVAVVSALSGIQLLATMDGTVAIFALPRIQNDLGLSDATRSWVISIYVLASGGLLLLGGRIGDTIGHKRTLIVGAALFTITSAMCGIAWDGSVLILARLLKGVAAAIVTPTAMALVATMFPKGPDRNTAMVVFGTMASVGSVVGLVAGGALTEISWRLAFLVNVPIGLLVIYLASSALRETEKERMKLDAAGGVLATLACTAAVFCMSTSAEHGWLSAITLGSGSGGAGGFRGVRPGGTHRREPHRAVEPVLRSQPGGHLRDPVFFRWSDFRRNRGDRPVCAERHGLRTAAVSYQLCSVRLRDAHRRDRVHTAGDVAPTAGGGDASAAFCF